MAKQMTLGFKVGFTLFTTCLPFLYYYQRHKIYDVVNSYLTPQKPLTREEIDRKKRDLLEQANL